MMNFIIMTASLTVAILLATVIAFAVLLQPKVLKWYMKYVSKLSEQMVDEMFNDEETKDL